MCKQYCIKQEFTNGNSPKQNGVVERVLGIIQNAALAACIQAPILFPLVQLPPTESLWAEAVHWSCDALNHTATSALPATSLRMRCGMVLPHLPHHTRSFAQRTAGGTTRSGRHPGPKAVFTSCRESTTQVTLCGCSRGRTKWWRHET